MIVGNWVSVGGFWVDQRIWHEYLPDTMPVVQKYDTMLSYSNLNFYLLCWLSSIREQFHRSERSRVAVSHWPTHRDSSWLWQPEVIGLGKEPFFEVRFMDKLQLKFAQFFVHNLSIKTFIVYGHFKKWMNANSELAASPEARNKAHGSKTSPLALLAMHRHASPCIRGGWGIDKNPLLVMSETKLQDLKRKLRGREEGHWLPEFFLSLVKNTKSRALNHGL